MSDLINEKQDPKDRYEKHKEWRKKNKGSQKSGEGLRGQNARKREMDKKLNKIPGRKQGGMEAAREAVRQAKESGELVQPDACEKCGEETDRLIFHHTHGYSPEHFLDGEFFCDTCHAEDDNNRDGDHTVKGPVRGPRLGMDEHEEGDHDHGHVLPKKHKKVAKATDSLAALNDAIAGIPMEDKIVSDIADMITDDPDIFN
jgi:hypothetical protein